MANDDTTEHENDDPAAAFEALRASVEQNGRELSAELTVIRKGLETAFEQFDSYQQPVDYKADIVRLTEVVEQLAENNVAIFKMPIFKHGPEYYARTMERHGESLIQTASHTLEQRSQELERAAFDITADVKGARKRGSQNALILIAVLLGAAIGAAAIWFMPQILNHLLNSV